MGSTTAWSFARLAGDRARGRSGRLRGVIPARDVDCGLLYRRVRRELVALLQAMPLHRLDTVVPATPAWSVQDVLAHLVGLAADLNAQRFPGDSSEDWTDAQVTSRRGRTLDELAAEWDEEAPRFEEGLRLLGYEQGSHFVGDLLQHTCDVRAALGTAQVPEDDVALAVGLDFYLRAFDESLREAGVGSVSVVVGGEVFAVGEGSEVVRWSPSRFEAFRALGGRRSEAQVRAQPREGDLDAVLPHVSAYPPLPAEDVLDA